MCTHTGKLTRSNFVSTLAQSSQSGSISFIHTYAYLRACAYARIFICMCAQYRKADKIKLRFYARPILAEWIDIVSERMQAQFDKEKEREAAGLVDDVPMTGDKENMGVCAGAFMCM
jgi:hypothetical protein